MSAKHTPGPWRASEFVQEQSEISGEGWRSLAVVFGQEGCDETDRLWNEGRANARLIAAAPQLLQALRELVARCDGQEGVRADGSNIQTMYARAVLEKAEGK